MRLFASPLILLTAGAVLFFYPFRTGMPTGLAAAGVLARAPADEMDRGGQPQPVVETVGQSVAETIAKPVVETMGQSVAKTVAQPASETGGQSVAKTVAQPASETVGQHTLPLPEPLFAVDPSTPEFKREALRTGMVFETIPVKAHEPRIPPQGPVPAIWRPLDQTVRTLAAKFSGRLSVVAIDLTTDERYDFRPADPYLPASTFKLPVTLCVVEAIQRGELSWDTLITFTPDDYDPVGAGNFDSASYGSRWPIRNLVDRSLISSNNVAVKMLARTLTPKGLWDCTLKFGGAVTRTPAGSTPVTASDEASWWLALWRMHQETPQLAADLLRPLRLVPYRGRIVAGTPRPDLVTHKFGSYASYHHDGAIIWNERPYLLVVMTSGPSEGLADHLIKQIASAAYHAAMAVQP